MPRSSQQIEVYLELGKKRVIAGAIDWPGWCRGGRDEDAALQSLYEAGPRYAAALRSARLGFHAPADVSALAVVERLPGSATTDFGAPDATPSGDAQPVDEQELKRLQAVLRACWRAFDAAIAAAAGHPLRKGPRGGGRDLDAIIAHVVEADKAYLARIGWTTALPDAAHSEAALQHTRQAIRDALPAAAHGELPERGPRGGRRWTPRYFVRRVAWHTLDHVWEIEDRLPGERSR